MPTPFNGPIQLMVIFELTLSLICIEHFIVWMRTAATPDFRKLWGKIHEDLEPGTYRVIITTSKEFLRIIIS